MKRVLSKSEMIDLWLLRKGFEPLGVDGSVVRTDGIDLRRAAEEEIRVWYARLLDEAPAEWLAPMDYALQTTATPTADGRVVLTLPTQCRRLLSLRLSPWAEDALLVAPDSPEAMRQGNPLWRSGAVRPVAVVSGHRVLVNKPAGSFEVEEVLGVAEPTGMSYAFDDAALDNELFNNEL